MVALRLSIEVKGGVAMTRVVCFGEVLLRFSAPQRQLLLQSPQLEVCVGGAEANVAVALAHLGHETAMAGVIADNTLGAAALGELRRHGVVTGAVQRIAGRMGLYFLTPGAGQRPSEVLYDRAGSAFVAAGGGKHDWPALLAGADWLHVSGVTPALGQATADATLTAMRAARAAGVQVSFDGNFRATLWQAWQGDAPGILAALMAEADLLFANERDIEVVLGQEFARPDPAQRFLAAASAAFTSFPRLRRMVATAREQASVDHHALSGLSVKRDGGIVTAPRRQVGPIVDRIGTGDAFAAGVLHGELAGLDEAAGLRFGLAAACLKHSVPGDFCPLGVRDIEAFAAGDDFRVRR
jgi:2-dehydro-3-deoxygluconokinase